MIVIDTTIVNVALPSIKADLGFQDANLAWVVNAYMLTFGGFLLLSGRLGDLFGFRRMFLIGLGIFTVASLGCGVAQTQSFLLTSRALQGFGGALLNAVAIALMMNMFTSAENRAKAMAYFSFVAAGGGSLGVLLGGLLTNSFDWHWNFLINVPIGAIVFFAAIRILPEPSEHDRTHKLDVLGAVLITVAMMLAVYATVAAAQSGWAAPETLGMFTISALLIGSFIYRQAKISEPLMPLGLFRLRSVSVANVAGVLWAASMFAWFFVSALYMQLVLGYTPLQVGLSFLPANLIMAAFAISLSAKMVMKFGMRGPITGGLLLAGAGLAWFAQAPVEGTWLVDVLPGMLLMGLGAGMAMNPVMLVALRDVSPDQTGVASGLVNTSFMMGGSLGLAVIATVAAGRTAALEAAGTSTLAALNGGYSISFLIGSILAISAATLVWLRLGRDPIADANEHPGEASA